MRALESLQTSGVEIVLDALVLTASFARVSSFSNGGMRKDSILTRAIITGPNKRSMPGLFRARGFAPRGMRSRRCAVPTFSLFVLSTLRERPDMFSVALFCSKARFARSRRSLRDASSRRRSPLPSHRVALFVAPTAHAVPSGAQPAMRSALQPAVPLAQSVVDVWCAQR